MPDGTPGGALPPAMQMVQLVGGLQISQALYVIAKLDVATQRPAERSRSCWAG